MKNFILTIVLCFKTILLFAYEDELIVFSSLHHVGGINGVIKTDLRGNKCAKVIVAMPYGGKDLTIESSLIMGNVEKGIGTYSFWVAPSKQQGKQFFKIRTNEYLPLDIDLWTNEGKLIGGQTYEVVIRVPKKVEPITQTSKTTDDEIKNHNVAKRDYDNNTNNPRSVSTKKLYFDFNGGRKSFVIYNGINWSVEKKPSFIHIQKSGNNCIVDCPYNYIDNERSGDIIIRYGSKIQKIEIFQGAKPANNPIYVSTDELKFDYYGGSTFFVVNSNNGYNCTVVEKPSFVDVKMDDRKCIVDCAYNMGCGRGGDIVIRSGNAEKKINILQGSKSSYDSKNPFF